jgi:hypothetical protein
MCSSWNATSWLETVLADALAQGSVTAARVPDEEAFTLPPHDAPRVVITGTKRGLNEDLAGLHIARTTAHSLAAQTSIVAPAR